MNFSSNYITSSCPEIAAAVCNAISSMGTIVLGLSEIKVVEFPYPHDANMLFARLSNSFIADLRSECFSFYQWPDEDYSNIRLAAVFNIDNNDSISLVHEGRKKDTLNNDYQ